MEMLSDIEKECQELRNENESLIEELIKQKEIKDHILFKIKELVDQYGKQ